MTDTPGQREEALAGAPEIQPCRVLRYMGTDIYSKAHSRSLKPARDPGGDMEATLLLASLRGRGHGGANGKAPE